MEIVAGKARGMVLRSPETTDVRPTSVRARKAFFDSLGTCDQMIFADLFAGSGAMGLEAASRGADQVVFVDQSCSSIKMIEQNCARIVRSGVQTRMTVLCGALPAFSKRIVAAAPRPTVIFADPPYAESVALLASITSDPDFTRWAAGAVFFWEMPDNCAGLKPPAAPWRLTSIRQLGPTRFMILKVANG